MGQNLSLRRPRISFSWLLRDQQTSTETKTETRKDDAETGPPLDAPGAETKNKNEELKQRTEAPPTQLDPTVRRYRVKQTRGRTEPLNDGYATTPTGMPQSGHTPGQKFFGSNHTLLDYKSKKRRSPSKELLFVCTPQEQPPKDASVVGEALLLAKKRQEVQRKLALQRAHSRAADGAEQEAPPPASAKPVDEPTKSLKGTYSEPSLIAASEGVHQRRHRHRKRRERERTRLQKFGYDIGNVDEFLSHCSLASPGNLPVVLSASSTLYQTRPGGCQLEIPLPLGMVVNAVFKNQNWLYVQTPHAQEGYVGYACCLPLGILPPAVRNGGGGANVKPPCWETTGDIFPQPCGNMTDSEKELRLRGGTRSDGARTPRGKRNEQCQKGGAVGVGTGGSTTANHYDIENGNVQTSGEHHVDKLYLRAASQPRLVEKTYAQLKITKYAALSGRHETSSLYQRPLAPLASGAYITNGQNGQHLHPPKTLAMSTSQTSTSLHSAAAAVGGVKKAHHNLRQTLVAISIDYTSEHIALRRGEIVTLCECRESRDRRQGCWFYVRTRDGREGYIPAEVAGHGYL